VSRKKRYSYGTRKEKLEGVRYGLGAVEIFSPKKLTKSMEDCN